MAESAGDAKERVLFEGQRVFIIVNAAGALALLVFLNAIWPQAGAVPLKRFVLYGIAAFAAGVGIAMLGYVVRYWALSRGKSAGLISSDRAAMDSDARGGVLRRGDGAAGDRRARYARRPAAGDDARGAGEEAVGRHAPVPSAFARRACAISSRSKPRPGRS